MSDAVGVAGALCIVGAYFYLQLGRLPAESLAFSVINGLGAAGIIFSLAYDFNLSAMVIEVFWLAISVFGMVRAIKLRRSRASAPHE